MIVRTSLNLLYTTRSHRLSCLSAAFSNLPFTTPTTKWEMGIRKFSR